MKYITKSDFMSRLKCPHLATLSEQIPDEAENVKATSLGTFFGEEARKSFKGSVTVHYDKPENMAKYTNKLIESGFEYIAEASFIYNDLFCSCDILRVIDAKKKICEIYEVKSVTEYTAHHILDASFQRYILSCSGWDVIGVYIVTVNSKYVNETGEMDIEQVFLRNNVTTETAAEMVYMPDKVQQVRDIIASKTPTESCLGNHCRDGYDCPYLKHCMKATNADVFDIGAIRFATKVKLYNAGVKSYQDIIDNAKKHKISASAVAQAVAHASGSESPVEKDKIKDFIQSFKFPLYFLDFESFQMAMPEWKGTSPYQQIPFQYSLHKMGANGKVKHMEFLAEPGQDPRRAIAESLCENIKRKGTILAYNSAFEKTRIRELAALFPDLKNKLLKLEARIEDLMVPFQKRWIYKTAQQGSYSIKYVLPALFPGDPRLDYHSLNNVHNGTEAMTEYSRLLSYTPEEREIITNDLLRYCELDTYALVLVYNYLRDLVL